MLTHVFTLAVALLVQAAQPPTNFAQQPPADPAQMSLAERAAAARKAASENDHKSAPPDTRNRTSLSPEQRGSIRGTAYVNDFLHFRIELGGWEPLSAERLASSKALARRWVPEENDSPNRVLSVGNGADLTLSLILVPLRQHSSLSADDLGPGTKQIVLDQLALAKDLTNIKDYKEPVLWGDPTHRFAAFRVACTLHDSLRVQSTQLTIVNGFILLFSVTGDSDHEVSDALRSFKAALAWTDAKP
jgi:hypothetical protein